MQVRKFGGFFAFCYSFAQNYQAISYYRLDPPGTSKDGLLNRIKTNLAAGLPSMFGFTVYSSYEQATSTGTGKIPYPTQGEKSIEFGRSRGVCRELTGNRGPKCFPLAARRPFAISESFENSAISGGKRR